MAEKAADKSKGKMPYDRSGSEPWFGGVNWTSGQHRWKLLGYYCAEATTGQKMLRLPLECIDAEADCVGDIKKIYEWQIDIETDGGKSLLLGFITKVNSAALVKATVKGREVLVPDMDKLANYTFNGALYLEEYEDAKTSKIKQSVKLDLNSIEDVEPPGKKGKKKPVESVEDAPEEKGEELKEDDLADLE